MGSKIIKLTQTPKLRVVKIKGFTVTMCAVQLHHRVLAVILIRILCLSFARDWLLLGYKKQYFVHSRDVVFVCLGLSTVHSASVTLLTCAKIWKLAYLVFAIKSDISPRFIIQWNRHVTLFAVAQIVKLKIKLK